MRLTVLQTERCKFPLPIYKKVKVNLITLKVMLAIPKRWLLWHLKMEAAKSFGTLVPYCF